MPSQCPFRKDQTRSGVDRESLIFAGLVVLVAEFVGMLRTVTVNKSPRLETAPNVNSQHIMLCHYRNRVAMHDNGFDYWGSGIPRVSCPSEALQRE